jgi:protein-S-isoprenylcysteine O-methyltransferase Ste14
VSGCRRSAIAGRRVLDPSGKLVAEPVSSPSRQADTMASRGEQMGLAARFALVFLSTGAYLGLAILGWGGAPFFANPARIVVAIVTLAMALVAMFAGGNLSGGVREDRGNRWVIVIFGVIGVLAGFLPAYTDRIDFWTMDGDAVRWVGIVIFAAGGALRLWPVFVLGPRFSGLVAIQPGHTLVTTGIYRVIRHPSYFGLLLTALGWALAFRSGAGLLLLALLIPPLLARIHAEERLLEAQFGDEYRDYTKRTSRLIPGIY